MNAMFLPQHRRMLQILMCLLLLLPALLIPARTVVHAASTIVVTSTDDLVHNDGKCTLREAIRAANTGVASGTKAGECQAGSSDNTIDMTGISGTITLTNSVALPAINANMQLIGPTNAILTVSGQSQYRVFFVNSGDVRFANLTISRGKAQGGAGGAGNNGGGGGGGAAGLGGGLLVNNGSVRLENVIFQNNQAVGGSGGAGGVDAGGYRDGSGGGGGGVGGDGAVGGNNATGGGVGGGGGEFGGSGGSGSNSTGAGQGGGGGEGGGGGGSSGLTGSTGGPGGSFGGGGGAGTGGSNNSGGDGGVGGFGGGGGGGGGTGNGTGFGGTGGIGGSFGGVGLGAGVYGINGGAGGGGAGLGGAIFIRFGIVTLINTVFENNSASGGPNGVDPGSIGGHGQGKGGAIFINSGASAISAGSLSFSGNITNDANAGRNSHCIPIDDNDVCGAIRYAALVTVSSMGHPSKKGPVSGIFTITRDGDTTNSLNVNFAVGGTAVYGADYVVSGATSFNGTSGRATIPAGASSVTLTITPISNSTTTTAQTVSLTLTNSSNLQYVVDTPANANLIIDNPAPPWLVLLYLAGDDTEPPTADGARVSISQPIGQLIGRLTTELPPNPAMRLVVLKDGNLPGDSQLLVRDPAMDRLEPVPAPLLPAWFPADKELDMGKVITFQQFIRWARESFPGSTYTMLSIVDHGGGWAPDFGAVPQPGTNGRILAGGWRGMSLDVGASTADPESGIISSLSTKNTSDVFAGLGDLGKFDVLFYDACLMGMIETAYQVQPYAKYWIAGENLLWANLPYERYLAPKLPKLNDPSKSEPMLDGSTTPDLLAKRIVQRYNQPYLPDNDNQPFTIAAIDMSKLPALKDQTNTLAKWLFTGLTPKDTGPEAQQRKERIRQAIITAYQQVQTFDYNVNLTLDKTDGYVDLADFARLLRDRLTDTTVPEALARDAAAEVFDLIAGPTAANRVVIATAAISDSVKNMTDPAGVPLRWDFPRAYGLSIYLPLGEEDCRATGVKYTDSQLGTPAGIMQCRSGILKDPMTGVGMERQTAYYTDTSQLRFTSEAPYWSALVGWLDENVTPDKTGRFQSPFPVSKIISSIYLPRVTISGPLGDPGTDLVVGGPLQVLPTTPKVGQPVEIKVTIKNAGTADITKPFWVDLYVDPRETPQPNRPWPDLSQQGVAWRVYGLAAGQSVTLSTLHPNDPLDPGSRYSNFTAFIRSGTRQLYVLVDSFAEGQQYGAVGEDNEANNLYGPVQVMVTDGAAASGALPRVVLDPRPDR